MTVYPMSTRGFQPSQKNMPFEKSQAFPILVFRSWHLETIVRGAFLVQRKTSKTNVLQTPCERNVKGFQEKQN